MSSIIDSVEALLMRLEVHPAIKLGGAPIQAPVKNKDGTWTVSWDGRASIANLLDLMGLKPLQSDSLTHDLTGFHQGLGNNLGLPVRTPLASIEHLLPTIVHLSLSVNPKTKTVVASATLEKVAVDIGLVLVASYDGTAHYVLGASVDIGPLIDGNLKALPGFGDLKTDLVDAAVVISSSKYSGFGAALPANVKKSLPAIAAFAADHAEVEHGLYLLANINAPTLQDKFPSRDGKSILVISEDIHFLVELGYTRDDGNSAFFIQVNLDNAFTIAEGEIKKASNITKLRHKAGKQETLTASSDSDKPDTDNFLTLKHCLLRFSLTKTTKTLTLQGEIDFALKTLSDLFRHSEKSDQTDFELIIGGDLQLGNTATNFDLRAFLKIESDGLEFANLKVPPGLWVGDLGMLIGERNDTAEFGVKAAWYIAPKQGPAVTNHHQALLDANNTGDQFAFVGLLEDEIIKPEAFNALKNQWNAANIYTLVTGSSLQNHTLKSMLQAMEQASLIQVDEYYVNYADGANIIFPDGTKTTAKGASIQAELASALYCLDGFFFFSVQLNADNKITELDGGVIIKEHKPGDGHGLFISALPGKGKKYPEINTNAKFATSNELSVKKGGSGNNPFVEFSYSDTFKTKGYPTVKLDGDLVIGLMNTVQRSDGKPNTTVNDLAADFHMDFSAGACEVQLLFELDIHLVSLIGDLVEALVGNYHGPLHKQLQLAVHAIVDVIEKVAGKLIAPSVKASVALTAGEVHGDPVLSFDFKIDEVGLNEEIQFKPDPPFEISLKDIDIHRIDTCVLRFGEQVGKELWSWFKSDLLAKALEYIGEAVVEGVEALAHLFAKIASYELEQIKQLGADGARTMSDLFTHPGRLLVDLGHDLEDVGHMLGFSEKVKTKQITFKDFHKTYLAPGGQIMMTAFEKEVIKEETAFFATVHEQKETDYYAVYKLLNYDEKRAHMDWLSYIQKQHWAVHRILEAREKLTRGEAILPKGLPGPFRYLGYNARVLLPQGHEMYDTLGFALCDPGLDYSYVPDIRVDEIPERVKDRIGSKDTVFPYTAPYCDLHVAKSIDSSGGISVAGAQVDVARNRYPWRLLPGLAKSANGTPTVSLMCLLTPYQNTAMRDNLDKAVAAEKAKIAEEKKSPHYLLAMSNAFFTSSNAARKAFQQVDADESVVTTLENGGWGFNRAAAQSAGFTIVPSVSHSKGTVVDIDTIDPGLPVDFNIEFAKETDGSGKKNPEPIGIRPTKRFLEAMALDEFCVPNVRNIAGFYLADTSTQKQPLTPMALRRIGDKTDAFNADGGVLTGEDLLKSATFTVEPSNSLRGGYVLRSLLKPERLVVVDGRQVRLSKAGETGTVFDFAFDHIARYQEPVGQWTWFRDQQNQPTTMTLLPDRNILIGDSPEPVGTWDPQQNNRHPGTIFFRWRKSAGVNPAWPTHLDLSEDLQSLSVAGSGVPTTVAIRMEKIEPVVGVWQRFAGETVEIRPSGEVLVDGQVKGHVALTTGTYAYKVVGEWEIEFNIGVHRRQIIGTSKATGAFVALREYLIGKVAGTWVAPKPTDDALFYGSLINTLQVNPDGSFTATYWTGDTFSNAQEVTETGTLRVYVGLKGIECRFDYAPSSQDSGGSARPGERFRLTEDSAHLQGMDGKTFSRGGLVYSDAIGVWRWWNDQFVTIHADGYFEGTLGQSGRVICQADSFILHWQNAATGKVQYIDSFIAAGDKQSVSGHYGAGHVPFTAHRVDVAQMASGAWNWGGGQVVMISTTGRTGPGASVTGLLPTATGEFSVVLETLRIHVQIDWNCGEFYDTLQISPDWSRLSGHNSGGTILRAQRALVGDWVWASSSTSRIDIRNDGEVQIIDEKGHPSKGRVRVAKVNGKTAYTIGNKDVSYQVEVLDDGNAVLAQDDFWGIRASYVAEAVKKIAGDWRWSDGCTYTFTSSVDGRQPENGLYPVLNTKGVEVGRCSVEVSSGRVRYLVIGLRGQTKLTYLDLNAEGTALYDQASGAAKVWGLRRELGASMSKAIAGQWSWGRDRDKVTIDVGGAVTEHLRGDKGVWRLSVWDGEPHYQIGWANVGKTVDVFVVDAAGVNLDGQYDITHGGGKLTAKRILIQERLQGHWHWGTDYTVDISSSVATAKAKGGKTVDTGKLVPIPQTGWSVAKIEWDQHGTDYLSLDVTNTEITGRSSLASSAPGNVLTATLVVV